MACGQSNFPKDFPDIPTLTDDTIITVSDGSVDPGTSIKAYKTTLNDIGSYIGGHSLDPPISLQDPAAFQSSAGTITVSGSTGTLTSSVDYTNIAVGDVIAFATDTLPSTVVLAKGGSLTITVFPFVDITSGISFDFGNPTLTTKDSSGNIINVLSSEGIMALKTLLVLNTVELADTSFFNSGGLSVIGELFASSAVRSSTYSSYPTVGYSDIRSADDVYIAQRSVDDGMVTYYHRPMLNAGMTTNQSISVGTWIPVQFNVANGTDAQNVTHQRAVVGSSGYDFTNFAYPIPYAPIPSGAHYSDVAYLITASVAVELTGIAGDRFHFAIYSGASATGDQLRLGQTAITLPMSVTFQTYLFDISRIVYLRPSSNANHRHIRMKAYSTCNSATIRSDYDGSWFNIVCLG